MQLHIENLEHQVASMHHRLELLNNQLQSFQNQSTFLRRWRRRWQRHAELLESVLKRHGIEWIQEQEYTRANSNGRESKKLGLRN